MTAAGGKTPILVVDDETPRVLRTSLAMEGYHVLEAGNGAGAIAMVGREKPEVVILDLGLPDIDGLDVIRRIRAGGSKVPIIVLSSRGGERGRVKAFALGADDYMPKPIGMAELAANPRWARMFWGVGITLLGRHAVIAPPRRYFLRSESIRS